MTVSILCGLMGVTLLCLVPRLQVKQICMNSPGIKIRVIGNILALRTTFNLIAKTVAVYKYAYRSVVLFCNTTGS